MKSPLFHLGDRPGRPPALEGKRTYLGILIMAFAFTGQRLHWFTPPEQIRSLQGILLAHWPTVLFTFGFVFAFIGAHAVHVRERRLKRLVPSTTR